MSEECARFEVGKMYFNIHGHVCKILKKDQSDRIVFQNMDTGKYGKLFACKTRDGNTDKVYEAVWLGRKWHSYVYLDARKVL